MKKISLIAIWLACCVLGCIKSNESPQVGTNTNWLKACSEDAQCGSEGACLCGVCTMACSSDTQCGTVSSATRCEPLNEAACGASAQAAPAACMQGCQSDTECTAIESGVCVEGLCLPGSQGGSGGSGVDPLALRRSDSVVLVPPVYADACTTHTDCTLVETSCNNCCAPTAIHTALTETFEQNHERACAGYQGLACACDPADFVARCESGRCTLVPRPSLPCFSPTSNLDRAYDPELVGCACSEFDRAICVEQVALVCRRPLIQTEGGWEAVLDGPCEPRAETTTCPESQIRPTPYVCLDEFKTCVQMTSGMFCGLP